MEKRASISPTVLLVNVIAFVVIICGVGTLFLVQYFTHFAASEPLVIIGGILVSIGIGLLALSRWVGK